MVYGLLACFVEENYRHNIRKTLNNFKSNIEDIKPKIMNNIRHLLNYNRTKLINKIYQDIKINLNKVKVDPLPRSHGTYYYRLEFNYDYYLEEVLQDTDDYYEYQDRNITETKKLWLEDIKKRLNNVSNEDYIHYFEKGLDKYGELKYVEYPIEIRIEVYSCCSEKYYDNTKLLDFISK